MSGTFVRMGFLCLVAGFVAEAALGVSPFPAISDAEKALTSVATDPGAPAVILFKRGALDFMDPIRDASSSLTIEVRLKVLTEEGKDAGDVSIVHSRLTRLHGFEGRTVLPDGREIPLEESAVFEETLSRRDGYFQTKVAFPGVEVGAILDYRYTLNWDSIYYLEPWYFHNTVPTVLSEIRFYVPKNLSFLPWRRETDGAKMTLEQQRKPQGLELLVGMRDLRGLPDEPYSFPFADLSSRVMLVPQEYVNSGTRMALLTNWGEVCDSFEQGYAPARRKDGKAKKKAKDLAGSGSARARAEAIYAFVRDEIALASNGLVWLGVSGVDEVLKDGAGASADQALLLQAMLMAVKVPADLVWAADRANGRIDLDIPNPLWFDRVLVAVDLDGERVYLDPSDDGLAFGRLAPGYEGHSALLFDKRKPEVVTLPDGDPAATSRQADLELTVDEDGGVAGSGRLTLAGHYARLFLNWHDDAEETAEAWATWLADRFTDFDIEGVVVEESMAAQTVGISWRMSMQEEAVLGDEVTLTPSEPLGPEEQVFRLTPSERKTPVQFSFAGSLNGVRLTLRWPADWRLDAVPSAVTETSTVGDLSVTIASDPEGRQLTYERRLERRGRELTGGSDYATIRGLYAAAEKHDASRLVLVRD